MAERPLRRKNAAQAGQPDADGAQDPRRAIKGERRSSRARARASSSRIIAITCARRLRRIDWTSSPGWTGPLSSCWKTKKTWPCTCCSTPPAAWTGRAAATATVTNSSMRGACWPGWPTSPSAAGIAFRSTRCARTHLRAGVRCAGAGKRSVCWRGWKAPRRAARSNSTPRCARSRCGRRAPGLVVLLSDLMSPEGFQEGLRALQGRGTRLR